MRRLGNTIYFILRWKTRNAVVAKPKQLTAVNATVAVANAAKNKAKFL
ncbi:hypothetical protein FA947_02235 [Mycoplasmoides pneumoniae]|nr:hypothetical protein B7R95_02265 [Mycoplasmoides pneumoniae]ARI12440.1 hypothetical protein B7R97_02260 [Mycoplasmoides pneumoniae]ARI13141.1 hypothetical protein B7R98_02265 [Mycoplasmoides pneumoniae]ARI13847.1 hypothetical protein B7R99_02260 [Mycoplasmoides pneumoniae]ARI14552.1 hypothetical protein B7S00_02260 [Mycoplasmoides pneumoniae]